MVLIPIEGIFNKELADVNQDGKITINDVTALQIILTKNNLQKTIDNVF